MWPYYIMNKDEHCKHNQNFPWPKLRGSRPISRPRPEPHDQDHTDYGIHSKVLFLIYSSIKLLNHKEATGYCHDQLYQIFVLWQINHPIQLNTKIKDPVGLHKNVSCKERNPSRCWSTFVQIWMQLRHCMNVMSHYDNQLPKHNEIQRWKFKVNTRNYLEEKDFSLT